MIGTDSVRELTQSGIAVVVVGATVYALIFEPSAHTDLLAGALGVVLGFYFSKTTQSTNGGGK